MCVDEKSRTDCRNQDSGAGGIQSEEENRETYSLALRKAMGFLAHRAHSTRQLADKLSRRFDRDTVKRVLDQLAREKLLDDFQFACEYARQRLKRSPRSALLVVNELGRRGVASGTADRAVGLVMSEEDLDEDGLAETTARKKLAALRQADRSEQIIKIFRFLSSRGFSGATARRAIERTLGRA